MQDKCLRGEELLHSLRKALHPPSDSQDSTHPPGGYIVTVSTQGHPKSSRKGLYRSLEQNSPYEEIPSGIGSVQQPQAFWKRQAASSMENSSRPRLTTRTKLYQIPISSNKLREKCERNLLSLLKLAPSLPQHNQIDQILTKMAQDHSESIQTDENDKMDLPIVEQPRKVSKRCSIMPALRPRQRQKKADNVQECLLAKKARRQAELSLVVEAKQQQIQTTTRFRDKYPTIQRPLEKSMDKTEKTETTREGEPMVELRPRKKERMRIGERSGNFFRGSRCDEGVYETKMRGYRQLLFIVHLAHRIFNPLPLMDPMVKNTPKQYYYLGAGNNCCLIRTLMKRRPWWQQTYNPQNANFLWTQLKIPPIFKEQISNTSVILNSRVSDKAGLIKKPIASRSSQRIEPSDRYSSPFVRSKQEEGKGVAFRPPRAVQDISKILTAADAKIYQEMIVTISKGDSWELRGRELRGLIREATPIGQVHNHMEGNHFLGNKKALLYHMQLYYKLTGQVRPAFPQTFHIRQGQRDPQFAAFLEAHRRCAVAPSMRNLWILKPGENSNRGCGISVVRDMRQIRRHVRSGKVGSTFILQKYIERPLLYKGRKFDIRHYMLVTTIEGRMRGYFHSEGYVRTSSSLFSLEETDPMVHLTNDAVQQYSDDYGSHEPANKLSYNQLQRHFAGFLPHFSLAAIYKRMRQLATDALSAAYPSLDPHHRCHNFQIFGLDFMIDQQLNIFLIEVNTNPCLQLSSPLLGRIIPGMLQHAFRLSLDPLFPPPVHYSNHSKYLAPDCSLEKLQFELIFDEARDGETIRQMVEQHKEEYKAMALVLAGSEKDAEDVFEDEGEELQVDELQV